MKNNQLEKEDFVKEYTDFRFYHAFKNEKIEIDIEPCQGGFCIAVYDYKKDLLEPKHCLDVEGYQSDIWGIRPRSKFVWNKAIEIANKFLTAYNVNTK